MGILIAHQRPVLVQLCELNMLIKIKKISGFTLIELLITTALIGIIAAFAIPTYKTSQLKIYEKSIVEQLKTIHAANYAYFSQNTNAQNENIFLPDNNNSPWDLYELNQRLGINLLAIDHATVSYTDVDTATPKTFLVTAQYVWGSANFSISVDQRPLQAGVNPYCSSAAGTCPTLQ